MVFHTHPKQRSDTPFASNKSNHDSHSTAKTSNTKIVHISGRLKLQWACRDKSSRQSYYTRLEQDPVPVATQQHLCKMRTLDPHPQKGTERIPSTITLFPFCHSNWKQKINTYNPIISTGKLSIYK